MSKVLARDYYKRCGMRLRVLPHLLKEGAYPDVVRESQELTELLLKGLLRAYGIDPPKVHDVAPTLVQYSASFPPEVQQNQQKIVEMSRRLRKDREISFYGEEDLIPLQSYTKKDATEAIESCEWLYQLLTPLFQRI